MADNQHPTLGNGKICYVEIPAIDVNASSSFYEQVFAWRIRKRGDGSIAFNDGVGQVSGTWVTKRKAATEPGLLIYIMVDLFLLPLMRSLLMAARSCNRSEWTRLRLLPTSVIRPETSSASIRNRADVRPLILGSA